MAKIYRTKGFMKIVYLDIMLGGLFVAQLPYKVNPIFPATDKELREYVVSKRPTLRNKKFVIAFSNNRVI